MSFKKSKKNESAELEVLEIELPEEEAPTEMIAETVQEIVIEEPELAPEPVVEEIFVPEPVLVLETVPATPELVSAPTPEPKPASVKPLLGINPRKSPKAAKLEELFRKRHPHMSDEQILQAVRKRLR